MGKSEKSNSVYAVKPEMLNQTFTTKLFCMQRIHFGRQVYRLTLNCYKSNTYMKLLYYFGGIERKFKADFNSRIILFENHKQEVVLNVANWTPAALPSAVDQQCVRLNTCTYRCIRKTNTKARLLSVVNPQHFQRHLDTKTTLGICDSGFLH